MAYEKETGGEIVSSKSATPGKAMTLQQAIDFGEYDPDFLATFPEWHNLTRAVQFQYIRRALQNREGNLRIQWAETVNFLDFSKKPELKEALKNIEIQLNKVKMDTERLYIEYSGV